MNKKLLTAAIGAALVAGPMIASAAGPTVFGNLHLSVDRIENDEIGTTLANEQGFVSSNNSDFGIKGDDDLGGGLKAIYQVRGGAFAADTGTSGFGGTLQDTFVGLAGGFGTARIGRMDTPMKGLRPIVDGYGSRVGDARNVIGGTGSAGTNTTTSNGSMMSFDARLSNSVRYDSPSLAGVVVSAQYGASEAGALSSSLSDVVSVGATWTGGPIKVGAAYETHNTQLSAAATAEEEKSIRVVGSFGFGPATVGGLYEKMSDLNGVAGKDKDIIGVTGAFKFGNSTARLQYFVADSTKDATSDNGGSLLALGLDHSLSKNTTVYAIYATADNDPNSAFKVSGAGAHGDSLAAKTGAKQSGISAGLEVKF